MKTALTDYKRKITRVKIKRWIEIDLISLTAAVIYYGVSSALGTNCLINYIFHVNCPSCGMTRALISFVKGDLTGYLSFNPMALPMFIAVYAELHSENRNSKKL